MALFKVEKAPSDELSLTNKAILNPKDVPTDGQYMELTSNVGRFVVTILGSPEVRQGTVGFGLFLRKWLSVAQGDQVCMEQHSFGGNAAYLERVTMFVEHVSRTSARQPKQINSDDLNADISSTYAELAVTVGQQMIFKFRDYPKALKLTVREVKAADASLLTGGKSKTKREDIACGILMPNTNVVFEAGEGIQLTGVHLGGSSTQSSIISTDLDFVKMGIGGLDNEASILFRRAFASRVFPPQVIQKLGVKHIKGILLYGPPGCGKTLMARQIGQMLNAREPKIVNGPEILNKYVGESEANIRRLFQDAEEEQKRAGPNSGLHMIIFDEIDAICKRRGGRSDNTGVHDNVVTQLLSKMDGVDELDNILIIGMTNRKDLIDDALMRPGRFEVQMEIGLPDECGRSQILDIHTRKIRENDMLSDDVDLKSLAHKTINFSGAELAGLVRAATATAMNRVIKKSGSGDSSVTVNPEEALHMKVVQSDFVYALENDIKPMFGVSTDQLMHFLQYGMINWGKPFSETLGHCKLMINQMVAANGEGSIDNFTSLLLHGNEGVGTSALAVHLALESGFTFIKVNIERCAQVWCVPLLLFFHSFCIFVVRLWNFYFFFSFVFAAVTFPTLCTVLVPPLYPLNPPSCRALYFVFPTFYSLLPPAILLPHTRSSCPTFDCLCL